jgi:hypothetical protein
MKRFCQNYRRVDLTVYSDAPEETVRTVVERAEKVT